MYIFYISVDHEIIKMSFWNTDREAVEKIREEMTGSNLEGANLSEDTIRWGIKNKFAKWLHDDGIRCVTRSCGVYKVGQE